MEPKVLVNHRKFYRVFFDNTSEILNSYVLLQRAQVTSSTFRVTKLCAFLDAPHGMISNSQTTRCFFVVILGSLPFVRLFISEAEGLSKQKDMPKLWLEDRNFSHRIVPETVIYIRSIHPVSLAILSVYLDVLIRIGSQNLLC